MIRVQLYRAVWIMVKKPNLILRAMDKKPAGLRVVTKSRQDSGMSLRFGT